MPRSVAEPERPGAPLRRTVVAPVVIGLSLLVLFQAKRLFFPRELTPLKGRVNVDGRPVTFGVVTVVTADGATLTAPIGPDGTYSLPHVPPGPVRIAVASPEPKSVFQKAAEASPAATASGRSAKPGFAAKAEPGGGAPVGPNAGVAIAMKADAGPPSAQQAARPEHAGWFRIPGRYANPLQSGLMGNVVSDGSTIDLDLSAAANAK